jgi:hypothetical protein
LRQAQGDLARISRVTTVARSFGSCGEEVPDAGAAAVEPSGGEEPQRDAEYVREQVHHVFAEEVRGAQGFDQAQSHPGGFAEVVRDGEDFAGQFDDVYDDPEEKEGGEEAAGEEDDLIAVDAR